ncbi:MAG TPA: hypothetical protein VEA69_07860, partial [Tepidisphaeraceae bacterium]|nr:hypothetical protein [Tepidisphaeraceae bacterium]
RFSLDGPADAIVEKWCELPVRAPVTDADLSADGKSLAVLASDGLHVIALDEQLRPTAEAPRVLRVPKGQLEGVCFAGEGFLITAESREVYRVGRE